MDIFTSKKSEKNVRLGLYLQLTEVSTLTEAAERLLYAVDIYVCLHLNEFLHKGVAEGILAER